MKIDLIKSYLNELQKGSHKAFNAIYDMYADRLYAFVYAHTKSQQLSKDIVQDVFLKLWINHKFLTTEGSFESLLFTISKNKIIDAFRSQINKAEFESYLRFKEEKQWESNDGEGKISYDELQFALKQCKHLLSDRELQVFEMSREQGRSIDEIADTFQTSQQTVKNQLTSSLKKIRMQIRKNMQSLLLLF